VKLEKNVFGRIGTWCPRLASSLSKGTKVMVTDLERNGAKSNTLPPSDVDDNAANASSNRSNFMAARICGQCHDQGDQIGRIFADWANFRRLGEFLTIGRLDDCLLWADFRKLKL
jgi:hypothetical protein